MRRVSATGTLVLVLAPVLALVLALMLLTSCAAPASGQTGAATPTATFPPLPTDTPSPPTPTPTAKEQQLEALVQPAIGTLAHDVSVRYDEPTQTVAVSAVVNQGPDVPTTQELVKTVTFLAYKALWTSGQPFKDVTVAVLGPFRGDYGDVTLQAYGSADVTAQTAAKLHWSALTPDTAWNAYTAVFLATSYGAAQYWGLPTPTPYGAIDPRAAYAA
jgi:hypothetical protein